MRLHIRNGAIQKNNEGIKHGSYARVLQKRKKDSAMKRIGKTNTLLCPTCV
jgi:hypothetical protein